MAKTSTSATKATPKKAKPTTKAAKRKSGKSSGGKTNIQKILEATASEHAMGHVKADKKKVQAMSGILDKKIFDTVCGTMKNKKGLVLYDQDSIALTAAGREEVGPDALAVAGSNDVLHDKIKEQLKGKQPRAIFDFLAADGQAHSKEEIAEHLVLEVNKSFGTYLSALSRYTDKLNDGKYILKDDVFPFGRPNSA
jgi:hypothetical protein